MIGQVSRGTAGDYQADERVGAAQLAVDYQADERAGVARLSWRLSSRRTGRCRVAELSIIKQMSRHVSRGSAGDYQAHKQAGFARLSFRLSSNEQAGVAGLSCRLPSK